MRFIFESAAVIGAMGRERKREKEDERKRSTELSNTEEEGEYKSLLVCSCTLEHSPNVVGNKLKKPLKPSFNMDTVHSRKPTSPGRDIHMGNCNSRKTENRLKIRNRPSTER